MNEQGHLDETAAPAPPFKIQPHHLEGIKEHVPEYMIDGLVRYLEEGIIPGDFLTAVLENNLVKAVSHVDGTNRHHLIDYATVLFNYMPSAAWGSQEKVEAWAKARRGIK